MIKIIQDNRTLKAMAKKGFIKLNPDNPNLFHYVDYAKDKNNNDITKFEYKNKSFELKFISGCFYPYVVEVLKNENQ